MLQRLRIRLGSIGILVLGAACTPPSGSPASCEALCQSDGACMKALAMDGIAPEGSTQGDRGLCNGICSSLRTMKREYLKQAGEMGVEAEWKHACMP